jgi:hypothetical protein
MCVVLLSTLVFLLAQLHRARVQRSLDRERAFSQQTFGMLSCFHRSPCSRCRSLTDHSRITARRAQNTILPPSSCHWFLSLFPFLAGREGGSTHLPRATATAPGTQRYTYRVRKSSMGAASGLLLQRLRRHPSPPRCHSTASNCCLRRLILSCHRLAPPATYTTLQRKAWISPQFIKIQPVQPSPRPVVITSTTTTLRGDEASTASALCGDDTTTELGPAWFWLPPSTCHRHLERLAPSAAQHHQHPH